jgi:hypothetical protein
MNSMDLGLENMVAGITRYIPISRAISFTLLLLGVEKLSRITMMALYSLFQSRHRCQDKKTDLFRVDCSSLFARSLPNSV